MKICKQIDEYIAFVRSDEAVVCKEQLLLCDFVEKVFAEEDVYVDEKQLERYLGLQKHFPYKLLPWEQFCFALHNCVYRRDGQLRFPVLVILVGRGAGKNGYLAFEDFALMTPINGVKYYHIDMFATSEDQAKATFEDIYNILEDKKNYFKNYFKWNLECITNINTGSKLKYHTRAPGTKDGGRPGKVDFDEYHAYENYKLIEVATGGLGKKQFPRRTIITTQGDVRDGPLDQLIDTCLEILKGELPDNGTLPFICWLDDPEEVHTEKMWNKANPSLRFFPNLLYEMKLEYVDYKRDPVTHTAFMTKRMNRPLGETQYCVTDWNNLVKATRELPDLKGYPCVAGIDYSKTDDFVVAGLLFKVGDQRYWLHHTWVCTKSRDLSRIRYPLKEAEEAGVLSMVNDVEISPKLIVEWLKEMAKLYIIEGVVMDNFRQTLFRDELKKIGFSYEKKNLKLVRPSDIMKVAPVIGYVLSKELIAWGTCPIMRWYVWNVKAVTDKKGNVDYQKIEPRSRKTDGAMAWVAAMTWEDIIKQRPAIGQKRLRTIC